MINILFLLVWLCHGISNTQFYKVTGENNDNRQYFDPSTFGMDIYSDPLKLMRSNNEFRKYVNYNVKCTGKWCKSTVLGKKFLCDKYKTDCYHVEHIIDIKGSEFASCSECKNIVGNMVMSYGKWNSALGGLARYHYEDAQYEKSLIYGNNRINKAKQLIEQCCLRSQRAEILYDKFCDGDICDCDGDSECGCDCSTDNVTTAFINVTLTIIIFACIIGSLYIGWICYDGSKIFLSLYKLNIIKLIRQVRKERNKYNDYYKYYDDLLKYLTKNYNNPFYKLSHTNTYAYLSTTNVNSIIYEHPIILNFVHCFDKKGRFEKYLDKSCLDCEFLSKIIVDSPRCKKIASFITGKYVWLTQMDIDVNELEQYDYCFIVKNFNNDEYDV